MGCGASSPAPVSAPAAGKSKKHHHHHHHHKKHKHSKTTAATAKEGSPLQEVAQEPIAKKASKKRKAARQKVYEQLRDIGNFSWPHILPYFDAWANEQLQFSPCDEKDDDSFKFITFTEFPPFTNMHSSLLTKVLTPELFESLKESRSAHGYTLSNAIQAGVLYPRLDVGFTCGDESCYEEFQDVIQPLIQEIHGFEMGDEHTSDLNPSKVVLDEEQTSQLQKYVKSVEARGVRNIAGFRLPAGTWGEERLEVEDLLQKVFESFDGELAGEYRGLEDLEHEEAKEMVMSGMLFRGPDKEGPQGLLMPSGAGRCWPDGRGVFANAGSVANSPRPTALCWVNEEDHCRIIATQDGGDVAEVFERYCALEEAFRAGVEEQGAAIMETEELGCLATCPSNVGTGLKFTVEVELPLMTTVLPKLEGACKELGLVLDGCSGRGSASVGGRWTVCNRKTVGVTEVEIVQMVVDGVLELIKMEEAQAGASEL